MSERTPKTVLDKSKLISVDEIDSYLSGMLTDLDCREVAVIKNTSYIYAPLEFYPLAPKITGRINRLVGIVKDMDGTTTTTEPLCLHSLEWMIRRITDRMPDWSSADRGQWKGLDKVVDYPHIIGNSTTKHVEYLIKTYESEIVMDAFRRSYVEAVLWTITLGKDPGRRNEVIANVSALGLDGLLEDAQTIKIQTSGYYDEKEYGEIALSLLQKYGAHFQLASFTEKVRAAVDVYYMRYHSILMDISAGRGRERSLELLKEPGKRLVEAMPGVGVFIALLSGWLGGEAELFYPMLAQHVLDKAPQWTEDSLKEFKQYLPMMGRYFAKHPVKFAVVTSSIAYEADIVLTEVFSVIREQIASWPVSESRRKELANHFTSYKELYDGFITATDSSEIRLKPHRDLYSIALHVLGISKNDYQYVMGFEDSESGTIAIRAAGIGLCIGVPFADTAGHDLSAATHILHGQLPETMLCHQCFLDTKVLEEYK